MSLFPLTLPRTNLKKGTHLVFIKFHHLKYKICFLSANCCFTRVRTHSYNLHSYHYNFNSIILIS